MMPRAHSNGVHGDAEQSPVVGPNLRRLRVKRGLSLERLARASGVSRAMLGQIELGQSTPTVNLLWRVSRALGVSFSTLITAASAPRTAVVPAEGAKILTSRESSFTSRALFPAHAPRATEFYEARLGPLSVERCAALPPGTTGNLVVADGTVKIDVGSEQHLLRSGDAILFEADIAHVYSNLAATEALMYVVMNYAERSL